MARTLSSGLFVACVAIVVAAVPLIGQQLLPPRDPSQPAQPAVRRIPIGTATISGTVTTADTGRPVRGARVTVNGGMTIARGAGPAGTASPSGGAAPPAVGGGASGGRTGAVGGLSGNVQISMNQISSSTSRTALTDALGNFAFERLPAGQYTLNVSRTSFLNTSYGQKKPGGQGTPLTLADGQKAKVNIQMIRGGVITGTVLSEDGEPMSNAQVSGWRYTMVSGVKRLQRTTSAQTDDRGMYRLFGLQPGDYLVSSTPNTNDMMMADRMVGETALIEQAIASGAVQPPAAPGLPPTVAIPVATGPQFINDGGGPPPGYLPVYYPTASVAAEGTTVHIVGGDERSNIDIQVRLVQASNIQGTVLNPPGQDLSVQLSLVNDDPMSETITMGARPDPQGHFSFRSVAPGKYTIVAQVVPAPNVTIVNGAARSSGPPPQLDASQRWWGRTPVTVEGEASISANVTLKPGRVVSGQVLFEMAHPPDLTRQKLMVSVSPAPGVQISMFSGSPQAEVGPDGRFTMMGVAPGRYMFRATSGFNKSAIVNGEDTLDTGFNFTGARDVTDVVLTVTDQSTEVSGILTDGAGRPGTDYTIVVAAAEEKYWTPGSRRVAISRTGVDGRYLIRNLPPGNYLVAAVTDLESGGQYDPEFLKSLATAGAMRISLAEGAKISQDLRVAR